MINFDSTREKVKTELSNLGLETWIECKVTIDGIGNEIESDKIPKAIQNWLDWLDKKSGWPIGIILPPSENSKQYLTENSFASEVFGTVLYNSYDYSYYHTDGTIFLISSLNESESSDDEYRIKRITELLFFIREYYVYWIISNDHKITFDLKYYGTIIFPKFYTENNLIQPSEKENKLREIQISNTSDKLINHFREEACIILSELFWPNGTIAEQELKIKKWMNDYFISIRWR